MTHFLFQNSASDRDSLLQPSLLILRSCLQIDPLSALIGNQHFQFTVQSLRQLLFFIHLPRFQFYLGRNRNSFSKTVNDIDPMSVLYFVNFETQRFPKSLQPNRTFINAIFFREKAKINSKNTNSPSDPEPWSRCLTRTDWPTLPTSSSVPPSTC